MEQIEIVFGGQGGQGVRLVSTLLGRASAAAGMQAASSASYGPEVRGSHTRSEVIVSDQMIVYPRVLNPDVFVALSQEAYDRAHTEVRPDGLILYEAAAVTPAEDTTARQHAIRAVEEAARLGSPGSANMVMLGAVIGATGMIELEAIKTVLPDARRVANEAALERGYAIGQQLHPEARAGETSIGKSVSHETDG